MDKSAEDFLMREGFDPVFGARPMKRALQRFVLDELAGAIIDGKVKEGDTVKITHDKNTDKLKIV